MKNLNKEKIWLPQNDEEFEYLKYCYNVNSTSKIIEPKIKYPRNSDADDDNTYIKNKIKMLNGES